jgi:hypothetical protein
VVGYSGLAGVDEEGTLARLRALRSDLIDPTIARQNGRVVKRTGDGLLIEFRSVVEAVRCAVEVQSGRVERNAGLAPERRIDFRVGVHLGDVVEDSEGDLMGDGVNIAARLEGVAKPDAICLSEHAYWQVRGRLEFKVTEPIHFYSLEVGQPAEAKPAPSTPTNATKAPASKRRWVSGPLAGGIVALLVLAAGSGWYLLRPPPNGAGSNRASFDRRAALHEPVRRSVTGLFRRRRHRGLSRA